MNIFSKAYCRTYQTIFKWIIPLMPYREPQILNSVLEISKTLKEKEINNVLLVTDKGIRDLGLTKSLEDDLTANDIKLSVYDGTVPNPTINNIEPSIYIYTTHETENYSSNSLEAYNITPNIK